MNNPSYDIFISYRREGGFDTAKLIAATLRHARYRVFLDVESLRAGKFNEQLYSVIEQCKDFIVVLPKDGLDRCVQETDWVRQEIIHAMTHEKNIIPVMLAGFKWPETMPAGLEALKYIQSLAAGDHEYFDAAMDKLKFYLKAKCHIKLSHALIWPLAVVSCLLVAWLALRWLAVPVCEEVADKIAGGMTVIDNLTGISQDVGKEWKTYYQKYKVAAPTEMTSLNEGMADLLKFKRKEVQKLRQYSMSHSGLGERQRFMLYSRGVNVADIEAFDPFLLQIFDDVEEHLDVLETYLNMEPVPEISAANSELNMRYAQHSANVVYYGYLHLLSSMPDRALKNYKDLSTTWKHFPTLISPRLPKEEYERLSKIEMDKMNTLVGSLGKLTSEQLLKLERDERNLKELKAKAEAAGNQEAHARLTNLLNQAKEIGASEQKLRDYEQKLDDTYQQLLAKCTLLPEDGQGIMWGKIIRLAKVMNTAQPPKRNILSNEINQRLDVYSTFITDAQKYALAVKRFYALVASGEQPLGGMVVALTQNNQPHPVLKVGDIVLTRKGQTANNTAAYNKAKELSGDDVLTFLRLGDNGQLILHKEIMPPTQVLTGFLMLKEEGD